MRFDPFVRFVFGIWVLGVFAASCASRAPIALPSDPGTPVPDFAAIHAQVSSACAGVRTLTAEIGLSGSRVGDEKLGGRVIAGFERPSSMRLDAVGPLFVGSVFTLVARGGTATLVLNRDARILRNEPPEAILEAVTGVALGPADLLAVFTGCVLPAPRAISGTRHANGMVSIAIETAEPPRRTGTLFLTQSGSQWQLRAARRERWQIDYTSWTGSFPRSVRLAAPETRVDIRAALAQVETNVTLEASAFAVEERKNLMPLTLQELRDAGPLRSQ